MSETKIDDGGLAFPQPFAFTPNGDVAFPGHYEDGVCGMTLRDYFAAKALQGIAANPFIAELLSSKSAEAIALGSNHAAYTNEIELPMVSRAAYAMADAALKSR